MDMYTVGFVVGLLCGLGAAWGIYAVCKPYEKGACDD
jgi:hypothetical protein